VAQPAEEQVWGSTSSHRYTVRTVKLRGQTLVDSLFRFGLTVYNLVRVRNQTAEMAR
jgi:hypothetical protein